MPKLIPLKSAIVFTLVAVVVAFLAGSYSAPAPATAQAPIRWKVQTAWPLGVFPDDAAKLLVATIDKTSGGRLKIDLSPAGAVVPPFEIQDAVNRGVLDAGHTTPGYIIGKLAAFIPLTHGPLFGMDFIDYYGWYWEGGGHELLQEAYQQKLKMNVVSFQVHPEGPQAMGWFKKEIRSFNDIKGQRYRIFGIGAETYSKLGIATVTLPGGEIVPALERGAIDGAEWVNCSDDKILGIDKIAKFHYAPGMHEPVTVGEFIINKGKWDALPADLKEIVKVVRPGLVLEPLRAVPGEDGQGVPGDAGLRRQDHQDERGAEPALPAGVRRDPERQRQQGRVLQEGPRLAEEVLQPRRPLPPLVLAEVRVHRRALLQGQDLAEVVRPPSGPPAPGRWGRDLGPIALPIAPPEGLM